MQASLDIKGLKGIDRALARLPDELKKSGEKTVLRAGARPIQRAAKAKAPKASGLLRKSIGTNVKKVKGKMSARIGPRKGTGKKVERNGREVYSDPNKYSHLVEFGTSHSAAQPFIRPAIDSASGDVVEAMGEGYKKFLVRSAKRIKSRIR